MADFGEASGQYPSHSERAAWLQGSSWDGRATWKQVSSSEEARVASCAAAKTGIFNMLVYSSEMPMGYRPIPRKARSFARSCAASLPGC